MFSKALLLGALAAFAAAQSSVLTFTRVPNPITDGEAQAITYSTNDTSTPVEIILRKGSSGNLQTVEVLTTDANGGQFIWTPKASLANGADYALEIKQGNQVNYFGPLTVQGAIAASVSASASAASKNSTTSSPTGTAASTGTGTMMSRNTTMVNQHNTTATAKTTGKTTAKMTGKTTGKMTATHTTTSGAGASFQATSATGGSNSPSPTGAASLDYSASSSFALVFGALAAILYLH